MTGNGNGNGNGGMAPQQRISRGIVAIYKSHLGRGPTEAKTEITETGVVTTLRDSLTLAEQKLIEAGDGDSVRELRRKFQAVMREEIIALIEEVTGRDGGSFLSDHDVETDVAVEMVVFASEDRAAAERAGRAVHT
jgi:uncharacterized protein YbcI